MSTHARHPAPVPPDVADAVTDVAVDVVTDAHDRPVAPAHPAGRRRPRAWRDAGQATAEYALVILGAALIAALLVAWATAGGGAGRVGRLFDAVLDAVLERVR